MRLYKMIGDNDPISTLKNTAKTTYSQRKE